MKSITTDDARAALADTDLAGAFVELAVLTALAQSRISVASACAALGMSSAELSKRRLCYAKVGAALADRLRSAQMRRAG